MSRHLLCCAVCCALLYRVRVCILFYAIDQCKWLYYCGTTNYSPISCACVCVSVCVLVHAEQCIKPLKSSFFMQNKTTFSLDDESINNSDTLL